MLVDVHTLATSVDELLAGVERREPFVNPDGRSDVATGAAAESCLYVDLSGSDYDAGITRSLQRKTAMFDKVFTEEAA